MQATQMKFRGCLLANAMGDAIGNMAFAYPLGISFSQYFSDLQNRISLLSDLTYTDDTAMMLGVCESFIARGSIDEQHLGDTFAKNFYRESWRGYSSGPQLIFQLVSEEGITYRQAAQTLFCGQGSYGNGAAMRIAPVALLYGDEENLYAIVEKCAAVTNIHAIGVDCAAVLAKAISIAINCNEAITVNNFIRPLQLFAQTPEMINQLMLLERLFCDDSDGRNAARQLGTGVAAFESVAFAIYIFLCHHANYEDCILQAGFYGGDCDTIAAMVGAMAGAYHGESCLPQKWMHIENKDYITQMADDLFAMQQ